jgi:ATP-dependent Clp protease protease subunit
MNRKTKMQPRAAGRVLSTANEQLIRSARDNLNTVLEQIEEQIQEDSALHQHMNRVALKPGRVRVSADTKNREADIMIYGDIGGGWWDEGITAESITDEINALDVDTLNVRINSGGGLVFEGIAIYNAIARSTAHVIVHIDGIAASIASVIAMAGDEIRISEGSHIMIHKPWSFAVGDAVALRKEAEILDTLEAGIIDIYAARTDAKRADLEAWVGAETWFLGQQAVDAGFADEMVPAKKKKAVASALLNLFRNTPQNLLPGVAVPEVREFEVFLRDGEGLSHAQAKRIAMQAMNRLNREGSPDPQDQPLRDGGGEPAAAVPSKVAAELAQRISHFTTTI